MAASVLRLGRVQERVIGDGSSFRLRQVAVGRGQGGRGLGGEEPERASGERVGREGRGGERTRATACGYSMKQFGVTLVSAYDQHRPF
eukprot:1387499-Rhodomonas_salina.2